MAENRHFGNPQRLFAPPNSQPPPKVKLGHFLRYLPGIEAQHCLLGAHNDVPGVGTRQVCLEEAYMLFHQSPERPNRDTFHIMRYL